MAPSFFGGGRGGDMDEPESVRFPSLAILRAYWAGLCGPNGEPPFRRDIDPRGLAPALEQSFMVERVAPGVARFRIAGMHLADLMGMDVRGMPMLTLVEPTARAALSARVEAVFARPAILHMALEAERGFGRPALEARLLMLPLRAQDGGVRLALGCLCAAGEIGRSPRRFAIARDRIEALADDPLHEVAEEAAPFVPAPRPVGKPYLRVLKGGLAR